LRNALFALGDHGPILEHLRQAETLAQALGDQRRLARVLSYMTRHLGPLAGFDHSITLGERALTIATTLGEVDLQVATQCHLGQAYHFLGQYRRARDFLQRTVASLAGDLLSAYFGLPVPASVYARTWLVASLAELGAFAEGSLYGEEEAQIAESVGQPHGLASARFSTGLLYLRKGDLAKAIAVLEHGLGLCQVWNIGVWEVNIASHLGYAYALSGRVSEAISLLEQVMGQLVASKIGSSALWTAYLSEAYLLAGRREEAMQLAGRALALSLERNLRGERAWTLRLLGEIAAQRDPRDVEPAETHYRQALALAKELGMRPLQAHCHRGLGTLYAQTARRAQACAALGTAIALYRVMDMIFWLPQAEAALAQVE
jgi:tetratricopeptide (TPR) repeat protein